MILNSPYISGSLTVTGNIIASGSITLSGSIASASYAVNASTASFVALAQSASYAVVATTASFADALTVAGTLTAQTLVVQTITSSVDFVTGSTRFGSISGNTHQFTGSLGVTGNVIFGGTGYFGNDVFTYNNGGIFFSGGGVYTSGIFQNSNGLNLQTGTTPRLTISSSGAVGIGTTTPLYQFDISTGNYRSVRISSSDDALITMGSTVASSQFYSIGVSSNTSGQGTNLFWIGTSTNNPSGALTKNLVINSSGNVGIGTSSPGAKLDVNGIIRSLVYVNVYDGSNDIYLRSNADFGLGPLPAIQVASNSPLQFATNNSIKMIITNIGKVGINNSSPNNIVDIYDQTYNSNTVGVLAARTRGGGQFITGRIVTAETSNQTLTIATCSAAGTNERIFIKVQVVNVSAVNNYGNVHVGYAIWSSSGGSSVTTMTLDTGNSNISNANVGSLSWSGNNLQYTTNRGGNYELNAITIWGSARDTGTIS